MEVEIVFTKSKKKIPIGSWAIRAWTKKSYSHVAVKFTSNYYNSSYYYQASEGLVNYMSEEQFNRKHEIVKIITLPVQENLYHSIKKECFSQAGADYGIAQNLGIVLVDLFNLVGIKIDNPWKKGVNCSELIYIELILPIFGDLGVNPDTVKPHHIEKILNNNNYIV